MSTETIQLLSPEIVLIAAAVLIYLAGVFVMTYGVLRVSLEFLPGLIGYWGPAFEKSFIVVKPLILGIGLASIYPILKEALNKTPRKKLG